MFTLTPEERHQLEAVIHRGHHTARIITRARILLKSAEGWSTRQIAEALEVCEATVTNTRQRFRMGGIERVLHDQRQTRRRAALDAEQEAILVAVACSPVPEHHDHWTLRLLHDKLIALEVVEHISPATLHAYLKKMRSNPGNVSPGACPSGMPPTSPPWKTS